MLSRSLLLRTLATTARRPKPPKPAGPKRKPATVPKSPRPKLAKNLPPPPLPLSMKSTNSPTIFSTTPPASTSNALLKRAKRLTASDITSQTSKTSIYSVGHIAPNLFPDFAPPPINWAIPEFAFIGRSNVGKSSLIKQLMEDLTKSSLDDRTGPRVGKTPGKTKLVHYFGCWRFFPPPLEPTPSNAEFYLLDLPGYGYAGTVSKSQRLKWNESSELFLASRSGFDEFGLPLLTNNGTIVGGMKNTFVLIDSRRSLTPHDVEYLDFLDKNRLDHTIVLTKVDKLTKLDRVKKYNEMCNAIFERVVNISPKSGNPSYTRPEVIGVSSLTGEGMKELKNFLLWGGAFHDVL